MHKHLWACLALYLQQDNTHQRRRDMRLLLLPTRFPSPEVMGQIDVNVWTTWIHKETDTLMAQLEKELGAQGDPDDPFNDTANSIFEPI